MGKLNQSSFLDIIKKLVNMNVPKQQQNERQFEENLLACVAGRGTLSLFGGGAVRSLGASPLAKTPRDSAIKKVPRA